MERVWDLPWLRRESSVPTWIGLSVVGVGFVLLAYTWGRVAGLTNVAFQLPYVVSSGFTGIGLIVVGLTAVGVQAKRQDLAGRARALEELADTMAALRTALEASVPPAPAPAPAPTPAPARRTRRRERETVAG